MSYDFAKIDNTEKNRLFKVAQNSGIPLTLFKTTDTDKLFIIEIKNTPLKFIVRRPKIGFVYLNYQQSLFRPDFPLCSPSEEMMIVSICGYFRTWLKEVVKTYLSLTGAPDLWTEFHSIQPFYSSSSFTEHDFEMFTVSEKDQIREALLEFQRSVSELFSKEITPMKDNLSQMQERLDYVCNALERLNRFDWKGVAVSTAIGIATNLSVDTVTGRQVLELFQQAFGQVMRLLPK